MHGLWTIITINNRYVSHHIAITHSARLRFRKVTPSNYSSQLKCGRRGRFFRSLSAVPGLWPNELVESMKIYYCNYSTNRMNRIARTHAHPRWPMLVHSWGCFLLINIIHPAFRTLIEFIHSFAVHLLIPVCGWTLDLHFFPHASQCMALSRIRYGVNCGLKFNFVLLAAMVGEFVHVGAGQFVLECKQTRFRGFIIKRALLRQSIWLVLFAWHNEIWCD